MDETGKFDEICLLHVFSYLPLTSLHECSLVCKNWRDLVRQKLAIRAKKNLVSLVTYFNENHETAVMQASDFRNEILRQLDSAVMYTPDFALTFLTSSSALERYALDSYESDNNETRHRKRRKVLSSAYDQLKIALFKRMRKNLVFVLTSGIIYAKKQENSYMEIESMANEIGIATLFLPKSDEYQVKKMFAPVKNMRVGEDFAKEFGLSDNSEQKLRFLLILSNKFLKINQFRQLFAFLDKKYKEKNFAISGAFVDRMYENRFNGDSRVLLLGFLGSDKMQVAQVVIPQVLPWTIELDKDDCGQIKSDLLKRKLNELKESGIEINQSSFALQISCISRGSLYYDMQRNFEIEQFRKIFPNVPLIGLFGFGELGMDFLPKYGNNETEKPSASDDYIRWISYSTIFTIITIKE